MTATPTSTTAPPFDPVERDSEGRSTVLLLGEPATGKSAAAKCIVGRLLASSPGEATRVGIVDARGEYGALADAVGLRRIVLRPDSPDRLNPLDAVRASGPEVEDRRHAIVAALCEVALARKLGAAEQRALGATVAVLLCWPHDQPVLADVVALLAEPSAEMIEWATEEADGDQFFELAEPVEPTERVQAAGRLAPVLGRLLDRELRGCFDGTTTVPTDGPGVVIDLSALHSEVATLRLAALASLAWLEAAAGETAAGRCVNLVDEAWMLLGDEWATRYLVDWLERAEAGTNIVITHRLSDLHRPGGDGARSLAARAQRFAETFISRAVFRLSDPGDVALAQSALHLTVEEGGPIPELGLGQAVRVLEPFPNVRALLAAADVLVDID